MDMRISYHNSSQQAHPVGSIVLRATWRPPQHPGYFPHSQIGVGSALVDEG